VDGVGTVAWRGRGAPCASRTWSTCCTADPARAALYDGPAAVAGEGDEVSERVVVVEREGRSLEDALYRLRRPAWRG